MKYKPGPDDLYSFSNATSFSDFYNLPSSGSESESHGKSDSESDYNGPDIKESLVKMQKAENLFGFRYLRQFRFK